MNLFSVSNLPAADIFKTEERGPSDTPLNFHQTTRHRVPEDTLCLSWTSPLHREY